MYKKWIALFIVFNLLWQITFVPTILAQTNLIEKVKNAVTGKPHAMTDSTRINLLKQIRSLQSYTGKRINSITIEQHDFLTSIDSKDSKMKDLFSKLGNSLQSNSKSRAIKENLFFKEWDVFDPSIIAYNEKWLRDLSYIQDAKIMAMITPYDTNQVDIIVVTKDLFSYGGEVLLNNKDAYSAKLNNINLLGSGNSVQVIQNFENERKPKSGWGYDVGLSNILGTFISVNAGVNQFGNNLVNNDLSAKKNYISVQRPILHPNSKWLGGMEYLETVNENVFPGKWDSIFDQQLNYNLKHKDIWVGYQLTKNKKQININEYRQFIQYRHLENNFKERPIDYLLQLDRNYQNLKANFLSYTLVKQSVYRTRYLYGLGRYEDLPIGQSLTWTTGQYKIEQDQSAYLGFKFEQYKLSKKENYTHIIANIASSYINQSLQDIRFLSSLEQFSKLKYLNNGLGYRQIINLSFTQTLRNKYNESLRINSIYGIPQLNKEQIKGGTRISSNWETVFYNNRALWGFKSAPFVFGNITYIRTMGDPILKGDIYTAIGSGLRVRNENLVFGTIELKGCYFPRTNQQLSPWNFSLITNLRYKYNSNIVEKPNFVEIN
ncbi:MAG: hypothetical protein RLZZ309_919 [Bacteroidota bacterium]|jgi:hypothetical protein